MGASKLATEKKKGRGQCDVLYPSPKERSGSGKRVKETFIEKRGTSTSLTSVYPDEIRAERTTQSKIEGRKHTGKEGGAK